MQAEQAQDEACKKFEAISSKAKDELIEFKTRRVADFRKHLLELTEFQIKHAKVDSSFLHEFEWRRFWNWPDLNVLILNFFK